MSKLTGNRWTKIGLWCLIALVLAYIGARLWLGDWGRAAPLSARPAAPFSHVIVIMMENHGTKSLTSNPNTPYIDHLMATYGFDPVYHGVTHPSLPNYLAMISGSTQNQHTDYPTSSFHALTLISQLNRRHLSWEGVMQSIPHPDYRGQWYPAPLSQQNALSAPGTALYAKKHNPFAFFTTISAQTLQDHTVTLRQFKTQLKKGQIPRFVWITPNLCHDMHGQPDSAQAACPVHNNNRLERLGDSFLAEWVPAIMRSSAWYGNAVIFIVWDEANAPSGITSLPQYLAAAPGSPRILGISVGGGVVPLIVISRQNKQHQVVSIDCNHYCVLKTIENGWKLGYLGMAQSPAIPTLVPLVPGR
ncbi:MAG: alkaline phosphatase family protein [Sulfobacillus sp.]